jgi:alkylhydroperoxidase family enzyme
VPRVPYLPEDVREPDELVRAIRARRGGGLLNLDRTLLHSPAFAKGWSALMGAVRTQLSIPPRLRELAICAVAVLNGADYEFHHHAPELKAAGATPALLEAVRRLDLTDPALDPADRAVLQLTIEMTRQVNVEESTFAAVRAVLPSPQHLVELTGTIAAYNLVSRFLVAMQITPET